MTWDLNTPPEELEVKTGDNWYPVVALYPGCIGVVVVFQTMMGCEAIACSPGSDSIRRTPRKRKGWFNFYSTGYPSKEAADCHALGGRVACIEVEFTEGEGL